MRGDGGVACEGRVVGVPKCNSWGKCTTMPLMNMNSDWMSNASSGLCINLYYLFSYMGSLSCILWIINNKDSTIKLSLVRHFETLPHFVRHYGIRHYPIGLICVWDPQQVTSSF